MAENRASRDAISRDKLKSGVGRTIGIVLLFFALLVGLLFASGFWSVRTPHTLPMDRVSGVAGQQAKSAAASREDLVGTMKFPVDVPTATKKER